MDTLLEGLRAAAEETRLRILALCIETELSVSELTQILGQSQPRVSRHLKLMVGAGLLDRFREGTWAFYRIADSGENRRLADALIELLPPIDPIRARDLHRLNAVHRERTQKGAAFFSKNADDWDNIRRLHVDDESVERALGELLPSHPNWDHVDIGTGTGRILEVVAPFARRAVGIDLSHEMLTVARSNLAKAELSNCHVRYGDMRQLDLKPESFDVATFHLVLHYADDPGSVIQEAARLLRPGGQLIIVDFAPHNEARLREAFAHRWLGFTDAEVENWLRNAGLKPTLANHLTGHPLTVCLWSAARPGNTWRAAYTPNRGVSSWF